jgi:hypothetical protein
VSFDAQSGHPKRRTQRLPIFSPVLLRDGLEGQFANFGTPLQKLSEKLEVEGKMMSLKHGRCRSKNSDRSEFVGLLNISLHTKDG